IATAAQNTNNTTIRSILLAKKLTAYWTAPDLETADSDTIDKYYESINLEQEIACLMLSIMLNRNCLNSQSIPHLHKGGWSVGKLISLEDEELPRHFGTPMLCNAKITCMGKTLEGKDPEGQEETAKAKGKDKGKNKLAYAPKANISPPPKRDNLEKDSICHHCKEVVTRGGIIRLTMLS
nr:hypothetical protein [Tanacetum cinerariifolium]